MKEDKTKELLNAVYKNTRMATLAIDKIHDKFEDKKLTTLLKKQNRKYEEMTHKCKSYASENELKLDDISGMLKMMNTTSINVKTYFDNSVSHIAEMLIQGTNMGIIDVIKKTGEFKNASDVVLKMARDLQCAEEEFVDSLKTFLIK